MGVANQWNSLTQGGQSNYAYYVWKGNNNGKCEEDSSENSSKDAIEHSSDDDEKGDKYCCSDDFKSCKKDGYCNANGNNCKRCNGLWMKEDSCPANGIKRWGECTNNTNGCCGPATCKGSKWHKMCI